MKSQLRTKIDEITKNQLKGTLVFLDKYSVGYRWKFYLFDAKITKQMIKQIKKLSPDILEVYLYSSNGPGWHGASTLVIRTNKKPMEIKIAE